MRFAVALLVSVSGAALAHDADVVSVVVNLGAEGKLQESVRLTPATLALLVPLDVDGDGLFTAGELASREHAVQAGIWDEMPLSVGGQPCEREASSAALLEGLVLLSARFRCSSGELRQDFRWLRVLPTNYRVLLGSERAGAFEVRAAAQLPQTAVSLPSLEPSSAVLGFGEALGAGVALFFAGARVWAVLALLLAVGRWRRGAMALGLMSLAIAATAWIDAAPFAWRVVLGVAVLGAVLQEDPAVVLGAVLGVGLGGSIAGGVPAVDGVIRVGSMIVGGWLVGVGAIALGAMLRRRPDARRPLTRLVAAGAALAMAVSG